MLTQDISHVDVQFWVTVQGPFSSGDEPLPDLSNQIGFRRKQPGERRHESPNLCNPVHRARRWTDSLSHQRFPNAWHRRGLEKQGFEESPGSSDVYVYWQWRNTELRGLDTLLGFRGRQRRFLVVGTRRYVFSFLIGGIKSRNT